MQMSYAPLRTLQDVEELERVPLDQRVFSWDLNDWIARGCMLDPDKIAIRYIADGNPDAEPILLHYRELQSRAIQAANLFHSLGVSADDVVMYVLPTLPQDAQAGATGRTRARDQAESHCDARADPRL
jgi:fatty-acyl-CoA synthase